MTPDTTIDPRLLDDYPTETQPRAVALPSRTTLDDASGEEGREKRRKLNLYKCRQCRDARKKCYPEGRVWPQKCDRCLQHRPEPLECSEPSLNTRKRGPNITKSTQLPKAQSTSEKPKSKGKELTDDDSSADEVKSEVYERPMRQPVVKGIKREHPGTPRPVPEPPPPCKEVPQGFPYLPLGEHEFRILVLAPGRREDKEVSCSFATAPMSQVPSYEAVSYLWAGINEAQQMMGAEVKLKDFEGIYHSIPTKSNLYNALRSLRHPTHPRQFWVDALCIDRRNTVEKDRQIAMKRFIFHNATNLCFWLGEDANSKIALNFIPKILDLTGIDKLVQDDSSIDGWVAFVALLKNAVFSRLWLVQEVAVAQNVTLHCGQLAIHYGDLVDAVAMFVSFRDNISQLFRQCKKNHKELTDRKVRMAESFIDLSTNALRVTSSRIHRLLSLEELVSQLIDLNASDPRDRIFSVLAIAKDGLKLEEDTLMEASPRRARQNGEIRIEYRRTTLEVYQDFVVHALQRSQSLDLICRHWASSVSEKDASLPTWVRPLHSSLQAPFDSNISERTSADSLVGLPDHNDYNASRGKAASFRFVESFRNFKSIYAKGMCVDSIYRIGPRASEGIIPYEWLDELGGCLNVGDNVPEDFWRTLVADRGPNGSNAPSWYHRAFLYCLHHLTPTGDINTNRLIDECENESSLVVNFLQRVQSVIWNRKFLVSRDQSWIGLAPMAAQVGDIIVVLYGCSVPVVLRPQKSGGSFFQLVGECYVHGIMDGEALEGESFSNIEEEFELQ